MYYPNIKYKGINCQLIYIDEASYYYGGKNGWALIADNKKQQMPAELGFEYKKECYMLDIDEDTAQSLTARYDTEQKQLNKRLKRLCIPILYFICLMFFWKVPIYMQVNMLKLPEGSTAVYPVRVQRMDDITWPVRAEKVFKYDGGFEEAKNYIEKHNPKLMRANINICKYSGLSSFDIYMSDFDKDWLALSSYEKEKYIKIVYKKGFDTPAPADHLTYVMIVWLLAAIAGLLRSKV